MTYPLFLSILKHILKRTISVHILTDSKSLLDFIAKRSRTGKKRIFLDTYAARRAYKTLDINKIGFMRSTYNLADELTKPKI